MRNVVLLSVVVCLYLTQSIPAQNPLINNLGFTSSSDQLMKYVYNQSDSNFYLSSQPNGHLYSIDPTSPGSQAQDRGNVRVRAGLSPAETFIWALCCDASTGTIYGGTGQSSPVVFFYHPGDQLVTSYDLSIYGIDEGFIWSCVAAPDSFVYFAMEHSGSAQLLKFNKYNHTINNVFASMGFPAGHEPLGRQFIEDSCHTYFDFLTAALADSYPGEEKIRCLTLGPGGKIYGGTQYGFIFAYDPANNTMNIMNVNQMAHPGEENEWSTDCLYYIEADSQKVFGSMTSANPVYNRYVGTFEFLGFSDTLEYPIKQLNYRYLWHSELVFGGPLKIVGESLYIAQDICHEPCGMTVFNMLGGSDTATAVGGSANWYTYYPHNGHDYLAVFGQIDSTARLNTNPIRNSSPESAVDFIMPAEGRTELHPKFRSLAAGESNVYGGTYMSAKIVGHLMSNDDVADSSVYKLGYYGGANADAMFAYNDYIYFGYYANLGLGIYSPAIGGWNCQDGSGGIPDQNHNPLTRNLRYPINGVPIDGSIVRVNCIAAGPVVNNDTMLYIGTGPSWWDTVVDDGWLMGFDAGNISSILHFDESICGGTDHINWIEDVDYYRGYTFLVGSNKASSMALIIDMNSQQRANKLHFYGSNTDQNVLVDSLHDRIYLSNNNQLLAYTLSRVISDSAGIIPGFCDSTLEFSKTLDYNIYNLCLGNDGDVWVGYGKYVGFINNSGDFISVGKLPSYVPDVQEAYRLAASTNFSNKRIYVGASDGNMYVIFRDLFVNITSTAPDSATEDYQYSYTVTATSVDTSALSISFHNYPSWLSVHGDTLSGTPTSGGYDTSFVVIATDGAAVDSQVVNINVVDILKGPISGNITVSRNAILTEDVLIDTTGVLTINPGVNIYVYPDTDANNIGVSDTTIEIICKGHLYALGDSSNLISFIPYGSNPQAGQWWGIYIGRAAACSLSYCNVLYASYGIDAYMLSHSWISHCKISDNDVSGLLCFMGYMTVENSYLDFNRVYGINSLQSDIDVKHCHLAYNGSYGIKIDGYHTSSDTAWITYDTLNGNNLAWGGDYAISISNVDKAQVYKCKARRYDQGGLYLNNSDATVSNNDFSSNLNSGIYADNYSFPMIRQCRLDTLSAGVRTYNSKPDIGVDNSTDGRGNCTFRSNSSFYIYHDYNTKTLDTLFAVNNWYDSGYPTAGKFKAIWSKSPIKYIPYLAYPPSPPRLDPGTILPLAFNLGQNYPNPFNPSTNISFSLETPAQTVVTIYNILGQTVNILTDGFMNAGLYTVVWDGTDANSNPVSSGIYFYTIRSGDHYQSKKMTLLR